jgi:polyphosphate kinase
VFWFAGGGEPIAYIGSADMMHRNLDRRVEALVRITSADHLADLDRLLTLSMDDGTSSWHLHDRDWVRVSTGEDGEPLLDLQEHLVAVSRARPSLARRR